MRTKKMLRRGLTALAAALAMMTALAAPAFAYAGDSADSRADTAAQQSSASQTAVQKNIIFMDYLQNGITVKYAVKGEERSSVPKQ